VAHLPLPLPAELHAGVHVAMTPAIVGRSNLEISVLTGDGRVQRVPRLRAWLALPAREIPPLPVRLAADNRGAWVDPTLPLPYPGDWELTVTVSTVAGDDRTTKVTVPVGNPN